MFQRSKPPYAHQAHLPFAREPLKSLYTFQRLLTTLLLVPFWCLYYGAFPGARPRRSWSIKQTINVLFTRRIYKVTEVAGVTWGTHDPEWEPPRGSLKETRFIWADSLPQNMRTGVVQAEGGKVAWRGQVGCYVWPKNDPFVHGKVEGKTPVVGIFMHGGGYCHMSAHEDSRTSRIPRRLVQDGIMEEVYSVEYRLIQHAPFPAQLQDAVSIYAHVVSHFASIKQPVNIVLIGDSSGGNLALALARWVRDEGHLPLPDGLLLLSPTSDISNALPLTLSSYIPRPNADTDYLVDTPEPRALLQRAFLGFPPKATGNFPSSSNLELDQHPPQTDEEEDRLMRVVHSEYVSPCSPRVLAKWGHGIEQDIEAGIDNKQDSKDGKLIDVPSPTASTAPSLLHSRRWSKLFEAFPRTLILAGDAERLVDEIRSLDIALRKDGVDVKTEWMKDAVHDPLIFAPGWWDERVIDDAWQTAKEWAQGF